MKRILSLCVLFMGIVHVYAQKQLPGYYISNAYDTVRTTFNYYPSDDNPKFVICVIGRVENKLTTDSCLGFAIPGYVQFARKKITRLTNPASIDYPHDNYLQAETFETSVAFLKIIFTSPSYTLYEYHDPGRSNYFLEDSAGNFIELKYRITMHDNVANNHRTYITQLRNRFYKQLEKDERAAETIANLEYTGYDLAKFLEMITGYKQPVPIKVKYPNFFVSLNTGAVFMRGNRTENISTNGNFCWGAGIGFIQYTGEEMGGSFISPQLKFSRFQFESNSTASAKIKANVTKIDLQCAIGPSIPVNLNFRWFVAAAPAVSVILNYSSAGAVGNFRCNVGLQAGVVLNRKLCISLMGDVVANKMYSWIGGEKISQRAVILNADWRFHL